MRTLERGGLLNRDLEALPTPARGRAGWLDRDEGLTAPELSVLMAYTKIVLAEDLLRSDLPDDPFLRSELFSYFPARCARATAARWSSTSCAARSWSPRSSTSWSTTPASPTSTGWPGRPTRPRPS